MSHARRAANSVGSDDDEENEIAELRKTNGYTKQAEMQGTKALPSSNNNPHLSSNTKKSESPPPPTKPKETDEEESLRQMFPMSFGGPKKVETKKPTVVKGKEKVKESESDGLKKAIEEATQLAKNSTQREDKATEKLSKNLSQKLSTQNTTEISEDNETNGTVTHSNLNTISNPSTTPTPPTTTTTTTTTATNTTPSTTERFVGPQRPPAGFQDSSDEENESDSEDESSSSCAPQTRIPLSHEAVLKGHVKSVSSIALDPSGSRALSGSYDYMVKFWDFAGMDQTLRSFREVEPQEGHSIKALSFSKSGDRFLVCPNSARAKIYDRDGFEQCQFIKGDMYISDMAQTKGHVGGMVAGMFHPIEDNTVMTCAIDGSIRLWEVSNPDKQKVVIKSKDARGVKVAFTTATISPNGALIAGACIDGSIQIWKGKGPYSRPDQVVRDAHPSGSETSSLVFSDDNTTLYSRGGDDSTMKVWDIRNLQVGPLHVWNDLPNFYPETDIFLSPDQKYVGTGTSVRPKQEGSGLLVFFDRATHSLVRQIGVSNSSVIRAMWHPRLNQIMLGCSDGSARVLYDPQISVRGGVLCMSRAPRKKDPADLSDVLQPAIKTPHSLPLYREALTEKKQRRVDRKDPLKSHKPEAPAPGTKGELGTSWSHELMKKIGMAKKMNWRSEDPREAIIRHAEEANNNPLWTKAYKETQPVAKFDEENDDESDATSAQIKRRKVFF